jgi:hypothetical protein
MSIRLNRRRSLAVLTMAMIAGGAIWAISASARVSPINDKFQAEGEVRFSKFAGTCTLKASGTMPASGSVITASTVTFTGCKDSGAETFTATAKGPWTFTLAWGLPATVKLSAPNEGITLKIVKGPVGTCTWTSHAFTDSAQTWENGVSEKEKETEGAVFTKSESEFTGQEIPGEETEPGDGCDAGSLIAMNSTNGLTWEDLTHTKQAILNGN